MIKILKFQLRCSVHIFSGFAGFRDAVLGLKPDKEKHEFFMDVVPEFGIPLAIRPRFQLNAIIGKYLRTENEQNQVIKLKVCTLLGKIGFLPVFCYSFPGFHPPIMKNWFLASLLLVFKI